MPGLPAARLQVQLREQPLELPPMSYQVGIAATIVIGGGVLSGVASELIDAKISKRHSTVADFVISGLIGGVGSLIGYGAGGGHEGLVAVKEGVKELVGSFKKRFLKKLPGISLMISWRKLQREAYLELSKWRLTKHCIAGQNYFFRTWGNKT